jgi:hypothetical protein
MLILLYDYFDVTQFDNYMYNFLLICLYKNFSHFSSIDVTPFTLRRWRIVSAACGTIWSRFGRVSLKQVALWCV